MQIYYPEYPVEGDVSKSSRRLGKKPSWILGLLRVCGRLDTEFCFFSFATGAVLRPLYYSTLFPICPKCLGVCVCVAFLPNVAYIVFLTHDCRSLPFAGPVYAVCCLVRGGTDRPRQRAGSDVPVHSWPDRPAECPIRHASGGSAVGCRLTAHLAQRAPAFGCGLKFEHTLTQSASVVGDGSK